MKTVLLDKIASVTRACGLKREVRVSADIPCEEGVVIAVRVRNDKTTYSQLELPSIHMAQVKQGDVIAGALGHRHALFGYSGHLPGLAGPRVAEQGVAVAEEPRRSRPLLHLRHAAARQLELAVGGLVVAHPHGHPSSQGMSALTRTSRLRPQARVTGRSCRAARSS